MPDGPEAVLLQECADAFSRQDFDAVLRSALKLQKYPEQRETAVMYRGVALYHKLKFREAQKILYRLYLRKLVKHRVEDDNLLFYLGMCYLYMLDMKRAIAVFARLEEKHSDNVEYKIMLYLALNMNGDYLDAGTVFLESLASDDVKTTRTLEQLMMKTLENSELSGTAKITLIQMLRNFRKAS